MYETQTEPRIRKVKPFLCQDCGTTEPDDFKPGSKGRCRNCLNKWMAAQHYVYPTKPSIRTEKILKPHLCKSCGETDPEKFKKNEKSTCYTCRLDINKESYLPSAPRVKCCEGCGETDADKFRKHYYGVCRKCQSQIVSERERAKIIANYICPRCKENKADKFPGRTSSICLDCREEKKIPKIREVKIRECIKCGITDDEKFVKPTSKVCIDCRERKPYVFVAKTHLCTKCGEKDPEKFHPGKKSVCKECKNAMDRSRYNNDPQGKEKLQKKMRRFRHRVKYNIPISRKFHSTDEERREAARQAARKCNDKRFCVKWGLDYNEFLADPEGMKAQVHQERNNLKLSPEIRQIRRMVVSARARAKRQNLPFNLTEQSFVIPDVCPYLGIPLNKVNIAMVDTFQPNNVSLDKIIPELGYVEGNVEVISMLANMMKTCATPEQLVNFAITILNRYPKIIQADLKGKDIVNMFGKGYVSEILKQ
jgi:hypothetical protein